MNLRRAGLSAAALAVASVGAAQAQPGPSFDCAKAKSEIEKLICADPELASLDREIAASFGALRQRLDAAGARLLRGEQATFNATREAAQHSKDVSLKEFMRGHLTFLKRVVPPPATAGAEPFLGEWGNSSGTVTVKPGKEGALAIEINASGFGGRWVCEVSGEARLGGGRLRFTEDDVEITLSRNGHSLVVAEKLPPDRRLRDYCGANGSIEGGYLRLK